MAVVLAAEVSLIFEAALVFFSYQTQLRIDLLPQMSGFLKCWERNRLVEPEC